MEETVDCKKETKKDEDLVEFDFQRETRRKKGPSSPTTVLTMAGLFVCGSTLMLSGIIVLCQVRTLLHLASFSLLDPCFLSKMNNLLL